LRKTLQRERKYRTLIETTDTGYSIVDQSGKLQEANGKYVQLAGYESFKDLRGKNVLEIVAPYDRDKYQLNLDFCLTTKKVKHFEIDIITPQMKIIPIQMSSKAISKRGNITIMTLCRDITEQRKIEQQTKIHEQQLMQADKMASLGVLVSGVAHEINNPNNFVMLNIPILQTMWKSMEPILDNHLAENGDFLISKRLKYSQVKSTIPELLQGIYDGSKRIENIVRELKDYARLETEGNLELVSINEVIETAIVLTANMIRKSTNNFSQDLKPNLPAIKGNFQKLEQVIINLLENSCQAITDRKQKITISSGYDAARKLIICRIKDEGEGMSPETKEKIFDPFFTTKRTKGGTGLGLSVSSKIIKLHRGDIKYNSAPQQGTTVTIRIPQYQQDKQGEKK
jgi:PAS domain S-box-containing protein